MAMCPIAPRPGGQALEARAVERLSPAVVDELVVHQCRFAHGIALGCEVMTRQGELLGRILSVYINLSGRRVFYRVFTSWAAVLREQGFYLEAGVPYAYSRVKRRLIVPVKTPTNYFDHSFSEGAGHHR